MITAENISDYIDAYFRYELSVEEADALMLALETNEAWKAEFQEQELLVKSISSMGQLNIRDKIKADIASGKAYQSGSKKYYYLLGLGLLALTGTIAYVSLDDTSSKPSSKEEKEKTTAPVAETATIDNSDPTAEAASKTTKVIDQQSTQEEITSPQPLINSDDMPTETGASEQANANTDPVVSSEDETPYEIDPCEAVQITFNLTTMASCQGEEEGNIAISNIKGGTKPYSYVTTNDELEQTGMSGLKAGVYAVKVIDDKGCSHAKYVMVEEKKCEDMLKLLFRTDVQDHVSIPVNGDNGTIQLLDQQEKVVFEKTLPYGDRTYDFDGYTELGKLSQGVYLIKIEYINGTQTKGYLTIY